MNSSEPEPLYWEPVTCDSQGSTPYPYIYLAHWSHGLSWLVIDAPTGLAGSLLSPKAVRASNDTVPRRLQREEILDKVHNHSSAKFPPTPPTNKKVEVRTGSDPDNPIVVGK